MVNSMKKTTCIFQIKFPVLLLLLFGALAACNKKEPTVGSLDGEPVTVREFEAYLALKRRPTDDETKVIESRDAYLERGALSRAIEKRNFLDADQMKVEIEEFKKEMLIGRYFEKYLKETVTDQAVSNYYKMHSDEYQLNKVHAAHVLVRTDKKMTPDELQTKRARIQEAYQRLKAGEKFQDIAKEYSEDKISAVKGGDLGWLAGGAIDKGFSQKVFATKPGEITEPFDSPFGYHIVTVLDEPRVSKVPLERVSGKIRYKLRDEARKAEMDRLKKSVKVETTAFTLNSLKAQDKK